MCVSIGTQSRTEFSLQITDYARLESQHRLVKHGSNDTVKWLLRKIYNLVH